MSHRQSGFSAAILRNSLLALTLAVGLAPAAYAEEDFYYLQPQAAVLRAPQAPVPAAVKSRAAAGYLTTAQLQIANFPAPPAPGSAVDKADMAAVLQWQKARTQDQCDAALAPSEETFVSFFGEVSPFQDPLPAAVGAFFKRVGYDSGSANRYVKKVYQRERPFLRSAEVSPCLGRVNGFSYPSGHATMSHLFGLILSDLLPRQGAIFMRAADQAALNRVIGGVHHPSDTEAGKKMGDQLYKELRRNPAFAADMAALNGYIR